MSSVLEEVGKARGAARFRIEQYAVPETAERSAAFFARRRNTPEWDAVIQTLKSFRSLEDDWDGDGSLAPGPELVDGAIAFAQSVQLDGMDPPDRVVVSVNGTIYFEWHRPEEYHELEVLSPIEAEVRFFRHDSDEVSVARWSRLPAA